MPPIERPGPSRAKLQRHGRRRHPLCTVVYANQSAAEDGRDAMIEALDPPRQAIISVSLQARHAAPGPACLHAPRRLRRAAKPSGA
jgi:hypothetical protein